MKRSFERLVSGLLVAAMLVLNDGRRRFRHMAATDALTGLLNRNGFDRALEAYPGTLVYNGDLFTPSDIGMFCRQYPQVTAVMTGRGLMSDPSLLRQTRGGRPASRQELAAFHDRLLTLYTARPSGDTPVLHRMRELWNYLSGSFEDTERPLKTIRKAKDLPAYEAAAQEILRSCPLKDAK